MKKKKSPWETVREKQLTLLLIFLALLNSHCASKDLAKTHYDLRDRDAFKKELKDKLAADALYREVMN